MLKHLRLPLRFDAARMLEETRALEDRSWQAHYQTRHYEGGWRALPLRSLEGRADDIFISPRPDASYRDTPLLDACPYLREVLRTFQCPLLAVRLMKLEAGAIIKEHRDAELCAEKGEARFHIPVLTHPDVVFMLGGNRLPLEAGECWYLNFDLPHSVRNGSPVDRIHLVVDAAVNDWVRALLADPRCEFRQEMDEMERYSAEERRAMIDSLRRIGTPTALQMAEDLANRLLSRP